MPKAKKKKRNQEQFDPAIKRVITTYQEFDLMWNVKNPKYNNVSQRSKCLAQLIERLDLPSN